MVKVVKKHIDFNKVLLFFSLEKFVDTLGHVKILFLWLFLSYIVYPFFMNSVH